MPKKILPVPVPVPDPDRVLDCEFELEAAFSELAERGYVTLAPNYPLLAKYQPDLKALGWQSGTATLKNGTWPTPTYLYGAGGGTSRLFAQPVYQQGVVPDAMALGATSGGRSQKMRVVPDVSAIADPNTGMLVGETQQFSDGVYYDEYRIGGTSLASPIYAGVFALVVKAAGHDYHDVCEV